MLVSCSLSPQLKVRSPHFSGSHQRRAVSHSSYAPSFCQIPAFTLPVSGLFVSQLRDCVSNFKFRDSCGADPYWSSGGGSHHTFASQSQQSSPTTVQGFEVRGKMEQKAALRLAALSWHPRSYDYEQCSMLVPPVVLVTQRILGPCCHSWDSASFCHLSTFKPVTSTKVANF